MPYPGITDPEMTKMMDKCVEDVMGKGHDKSSAIAICHESVTKGKEVSSILPAGIAMDEMIRIARAILDAPEVTDKASVSQGGGPRGTPSSDQPSSSQGYRYGNGLERCFIHMERLLGDAEQARKVCKDVFGMMEKEARLTEKASDSPSDYLIVEDRGKPTTWHLQVKTDGKPDHRLMGAAWAALMSPNGFRGNKYEGPNKTEAIAKLRKMYAAEDMPVPSEKEIVPSELSIVKQKDGSYRWFLTTSSSYRDHDGEIVSQKAQEDDTARMNATGKFGVVNWWHWYRHNGQWKKSKELSSFELQEAIPLRLGVCDLSGMQGKVRIESGTFDDAFVAERMTAHQKELGASLEFLHSVNDPDTDGVYHSITTLARAILPKERASNKLTQLIVAKENTVNILDSISKALGGDNAAQEKAREIVQAVENTDKAAQVAKLESKEQDEKKEPPKEETQEAPKPMFAGDIPVSEFKEILNAAVVQFLTPAVKEISEQVRKLSDAQATTQKETGDKLATSIKSVQDMQTDLAARLAALEGLTPRAYRVTQDPQTVIAKETAKERGPKSDAQAEATLASWLASTK